MNTIKDNKILNKKEYKSFPFEVGKTYKTKMATNWSFKIERIHKDLVWGYYIGTLNDNDNICPLSVDRLIPEYTAEVLNEYSICPHCKKIIKDGKNK